MLPSIRNSHDVVERDLVQRLRKAAAELEACTEYRELEGMIGLERIFTWTNYR